VKTFIGTCVDNPFDTMGALVNVVENYAKPISKQTFLKHCLIGAELKADTARFPHDYEFYKSKIWLDNPYHIYFYIHSAIEYFYA